MVLHLRKGLMLGGLPIAALNSITEIVNDIFLDEINYYKRYVILLNDNSNLVISATPTFPQEPDEVGLIIDVVDDQYINMKDPTPIWRKID